MNKKLGFIGAGKMATAILKGVLASKVFEKENIFISDKNEDALSILKKEYNINICSSNAEVVKNADIILFAVKPFVLRDVLKEIKPSLTKNHLVLSIAAGISIDTIKEILGETSIIRIMPNTPALVTCGMSAVCPDENVSDSEKDIALKIFGSIGEVITASEKDIDTITAISGSGPAFYYRFIEDIARAGEKLGLSYETALKLSAQTALGSAKMIMDTKVSPEQLIINVTTPGGCTAVGNEVLRDHNISDILLETIEETKIKAYELGKQ
ncbi:pyrroline-5-carboxylate reductase [bacterium]|nr:pyrroline-5-carboxylate reductase [bacterium]